METPVSNTADPEATYDLALGEAAMLTGVVVASSVQADVRQANVDAGNVAAKMATVMARRMCNQHRCTAPSGTPCVHPDHRRDVDYLRHVLTLLGLPGAYAEVTQDDRDQLLSSLAQQDTDELSYTEPSED